MADGHRVADLLSAAGAALPGATRRAGQLAMAEAAADAFSSGEHLLVQAGTGTGKSLAYLAGVLAGDRRAVVATATLALQSQLVGTDLPRMLDAVAALLGRRPQAALLKGRANYLCRLQLSQPSGPASQASLPDDDDAAPLSRLESQAADLRRWAEVTTTGDRDELDWSPQPRVWRAVSVSARDCVGARRCPFGEECFAEAARERARNADVIVTNHSLLALDLLGGGQVLPDHDVVVVDEAHELVDRVTDQAADQLTDRGVRQAFARAGQTVGEQTHERLGAAATGLHDALAALVPGRLTPLPARLAGALSLLATAAADAAEAIPVDVTRSAPEQVARRQQTRARLLGVAEVARRIADARDGDVVWVEVNERGEPVVKVAPLDVSRHIAAALFALHPVVATSATLTVGGRFAHLARAFGLPADGGAPGTAAQAADSHDDDRPASLHWRGLDVGSPFDYAHQARLYVAAQLPDPGTGGPPEPVLAELAELVRAAGGRTLGLFTSRRSALAAADAMRERLQVPILVQGEAPLPSLVRQFRADAPSCLFGTLSLWQGVDAPGSACTLVVIDRIPFYRPDEPLAQARIEAVNRRGGSGFEEVSLARAAVLLAQGAGRLIRSSGDRGVVAVLDPRLQTRRYGSILRASLPPLAYPTSRRDALAWLRRLDTFAPPPLPAPAERELVRQLADVADEPPPAPEGGARGSRKPAKRIVAGARRPGAT